MKWTKYLTVPILITAFTVPFSPARAAVPGNNERVSLDSTGSQANAQTRGAAISKDGRYVAFNSSASNLVSGDTNGKIDTFVRDRTLGATELISVDSGGVQANNQSQSPRISTDGRYVVFESSATNLVSGDTNGTSDIFLRDRQAGTTELISKSTAGAIGNGSSGTPDISNDGRFVAFTSEASNLISGKTTVYSDVYVRDRTKGTTTRVSVSSAGSEGNNFSAEPRISGNGRYIAFVSLASNLVSGDTNGKQDIFIFDQLGGLMQKITAGNDDSAYPDISGDGRYVAFLSVANDLVPSDTNAALDTFLYDSQTTATERVSISSSGAQANNDSQLIPAVSDDGRYVAFASSATNLIGSDTNAHQDVFLRDRQGSTTEVVSRSSGGSLGDSTSGQVDISADAQYVSYISSSTNLVSGDSNGVDDAFVSQTGGAISCTAN